MSRGKNKIVDSSNLELKYTNPNGKIILYLLKELNLAKELKLMKVIQ